MTIDKRLTIENISFQETRDYIKKKYESIYCYDKKRIFEIVESFYKDSQRKFLTLNIEDQKLINQYGLMDSYIELNGKHKSSWTFEESANNEFWSFINSKILIKKILEKTKFENQLEQIVNLNDTYFDILFENDKESKLFQEKINDILSYSFKSYMDFYYFTQIPEESKNFHLTIEIKNFIYIEHIYNFFYQISRDLLEIHLNDNLRTIFYYNIKFLNAKEIIELLKVIKNPIVILKLVDFDLIENDLDFIYELISQEEIFFIILGLYLLRGYIARLENFFNKVFKDEIDKAFYSSTEPNFYIIGKSIIKSEEEISDILNKGFKQINSNKLEHVLSYIEHFSTSSSGLNFFSSDSNNLHKQLKQSIKLLYPKEIQDIKITERNYFTFSLALFEIAKNNEVDESFFRRLFDKLFSFFEDKLSAGNNTLFLKYHGNYFINSAVNLVSSRNFYYKDSFNFINDFISNFFPNTVWVKTDEKKYLFCVYLFLNIAHNEKNEMIFLESLKLLKNKFPNYLLDKHIENLYILDCLGLLLKNKKFQSVNHFINLNVIPFISTINQFKLLIRENIYMDDKFITEFFSYYFEHIEKEFFELFTNLLSYTHLCSINKENILLQIEGEIKRRDSCSNISSVINRIKELYNGRSFENDDLIPFFYESYCITYYRFLNKNLNSLNISQDMKAKIQNLNFIITKI